MALNFALSSDTKIQVVITADESVQSDDETRRVYLDTGDASLLHISEGATWFTLKALSPAERTAVADYDAYIESCYLETVRAGLVCIEGHDGDAFEVLQSIRPEGVRQLAIVELACHIQRLSLLGADQKK